MKDIKLTIEEIKKAVPFADGFEIQEDKDGDYLLKAPNSEGFFFLKGADSKMWLNMIYPLFLQRVIEGINKAGLQYVIGQYPFCITVENCEPKNEGDEVERFMLYKGHESAKTKAIKYILDKL